MNPQTSAAPSLNLNDIILPDPVGVWPPAPGWWLLLALLILLPLVAFWLTRVYRARRARKQPKVDCQTQLAQLLGQETALTPTLCARTNEALKLYCRVCYPQALALHGDAWAEFLTARAGVLTAGQLHALAAGPYLPQVEGSAHELLTNLTLWLNSAESDRSRL
ncbi:DUF4381 domain-containing protein [Thalassolituus sp. LLYu03]|uniref:DUF4381 domain-containing protein n=1 Tax=Thalassolituus sp. LLYu03 TaxID=3421656 RepID=UPI003D2C335D